MKLKNIFAKRMTVAEGVRLPVPRHFNYSTFGVRDRRDNIIRTGNFVCSGTPGTGFFVHNSESHSYHRFVIESKKKLNQNALTLLLGKEPNFEKELKRANDACKQTTDENKLELLSSYINVLALAKEEELMQRVIRGIKDKMGNHPSKMMVSILSHYKSSIATLEHDVRSAQNHCCASLDETAKAAWEKVIDAFHLLVESRRVWSVYMDHGSQSYQQVFFDMGIFDYIHSPFDTPVMRDHKGMHYYLYPKGVLVARSSVDFDLYKWADLDVRFSVVDISTLAVRPNFNSRHSSSKKKRHSHSDALSTLYGTTRAQVVGEIAIPKLNLQFFVNHTGPAEDFVKALKAFNKA